MNPADFQDLMQRSKQKAQANPAAFRRLVWCFEMLGVLYLLLVLLVCVGLIVLGVYLLLGHSWLGGLTAVLVGLLLLWLAGRVLWYRPPLPQGVVITRDQAPELFVILDKTQRKLRAEQAIDRVVVTDAYEVRVTCHQRWIFWGRSTRTLVLGLPLVLSLDRQRFLSVLVREYAHLRGKEKDKRGLARRYRRHHAMQQLLDYVTYARSGGGVFDKISHAFLHWFAPRLLARSAVLVRQEEYAADIWAARLCGSEISSAALIERALLQSHVSIEHWRQFWQNAAYHVIPPQLPFAWLAAHQLYPPTPHAMREALYHIKHAAARTGDMQPQVVERLRVLRSKLVIPEPSIQHAGRMLGYGLQAAIAHYDRLWWQRNRQTWSLVHAQAQLWLAEIAQLQARQKQLSGPELHRLAQLLRRTRQQAQADVVYARLRQVDAQHPEALWHDIISRTERAEASALPLLEQLANQHLDWRERACLAALELLQRNPHIPNHTALCRLWQQRQAGMQALEERFRREMSQASLTHTTGPHQLTVYEQQNFIESAQRLNAPVQRMWLLRNHSRVMPWRVMLLAIVEPVRGREDDILWKELNEQLDTPGELLCAPLDWWLRLPDSRPLPREEAIYDQIRHRLQLPNQSDISSIL